jgi:hypothetical protein
MLMSVGMVRSTGCLKSESENSEPASRDLRLTGSLGQGQKRKEQPIMPANYTHVNAAWPDIVPKPTPQEALTGAKRLFRLAMGRKFRGTWKLTSGRRHTWPRSRVF